MASYTQPIQDLITALADLPGIGLRSAERMAFHLLKLPAADAMKLADAIRDVKTKIRYCTRCYNLTDRELCEICTDERRDHGVVCVVEQPKDLLALEASGVYRGVYHVLLGRIAPQDGCRPEDLTLDPLVKRVAEGSIRELIMGTNPNFEGDGTSLFIQNLMREYPQVQITRLARGLPAGSNIEFANRNMLADALSARQKL